MGYFLHMENNQKPEWFELADNDQPADRPMKKAPKRSLSLILAGVLVIPMGAGFALLSHDEHSAVASEGLNLIQDSPALGTSPASQPSDAIVMPTSSREDDDEEGDDDEYRAPVFSNSTSSAASVVTPATIQSTQASPTATPTKALATASPTKAPAAIAAPSANASKDLILPPTKKADDDDDHHEGKKNKKSERDHEDDDEEDDD
jgi:hypothetical protein